MLPTIVCIVVLGVTATSMAAPVHTETNVASYLERYGYMRPNSKSHKTESLVAETDYKQAIRDFQAFAGLRVTGAMNHETERAMSMPRCGMADKETTSNSRSKRYVLEGSRWRIKNLTYRIFSYPYNLPKATVDTEIARAFKVWEDQTDLTFTRRETGHVQIEIRFDRGELGEFDGPGGKLAVAFFPQHGGDAYFDTAESWTSRSYSGTNLFQVAAHEFGHSLGLSHSNVGSALMAPFYQGYMPQFRLDVDDIKAIHALYGKKTH